MFPLYVERTDRYDHLFRTERKSKIQNWNNKKISFGKGDMNS